MTEDPAAGAPQARAPSLAVQVEGYLLLRAEREQARREAAALCARLPWLTSAQADDLACHYTEQRLGLTRHVLRSTSGAPGHRHGPAAPRGHVYGWRPELACTRRISTVSQR